MNKITDNKKFWNAIKPLFSNGSSKSSKITLVEDDEIITEDKKIAEKFNDYFIDAVSALDIQKNSALENDTEKISNPVYKALKRFEDHPSILEIKKNVSIASEFSFSEVNMRDMLLEINNLTSWDFASMSHANRIRPPKADKTALCCS